MNNTSTTTNCQANMKTAKLSISLTLIFSGIFVNVSVVAALLRKLPRLNGFSLLVLHLAFADLMVFFTAAPSIILSMSTENQQLAFISAVCKGTAFFNRFTTISSILILTAMSGFRFYSIKNPLSYRTRVKSSTINIVCGLLWIFSLILSVTPLLGWGKYEPIQGQCWCALDSSKHKLNYTTVLVFGFCLPTTLSCYFLVAIMVVMRNPRKKGAKMMSQPAVITNFQAEAEAQQAKSSEHLEEVELNSFETKSNCLKSDQDDVYCDKAVTLSIDALPNQAITIEPVMIPKQSLFAVRKSPFLVRKPYEIQKADNSFKQELRRKNHSSRSDPNEHKDTIDKLCQQATSASENAKKQRENAKKTFFVLIVLFLVYIAFCGPTYIVWSWYAFSDFLGSEPPRALFPVFRTLVGVQSVVNCLIYGIRHKDIRKEVIKLWKDIAFYAKSKSKLVLYF